MKKTSFRTERKHGEKKNRKAVAIFIAAVVFIFAGSLVYSLWQNDFNLKVTLGGEEETSAVSGEDEEFITESVDKNYLFFCCDSDKTEIRFMWLVNVQLPERIMKIKSVSPYMTVNYSGETVTLSSVFASAGEIAMKEAAEKVLNVKVDGYLGSTPENFKQMINYFGSVTVTVEEKIEYKGEFNLILMDGNIGMKGDTLYRYLCYQGTMGDKGLEERAETLKEIFEAVLKEKYIEREDKIFAKISNALMTDISIVEFSQARENVELILKNGFEKYVTSK